ncbi:MAG TPA: EF-hand domain-containing protein, partial [Pirellulaceae bacterium]|nr:EF-hand domain-containing protein [Pirellulaceae bacterium]
TMRKLICAALAWSIGSYAGSVLAQDANLFNKLDKNQDGVVAPDEVEGEGKGLFERMLRNADANKDGKLSKDEFAKGLQARPAPENAARPGIEEILTRIDKNGDGKVSKDEAPERLAAGFERLDTNGDGTLDKAELGKMFQVAMQRPGGAGGQPGPGGPPPEMAAGRMVLKALDADGNGELSASEIADSAKILAKFDTNSDGKIAKEELLAQLPPPPRGQEGRPGAPGQGNPLEMLLRRLKEADTNGDGKISKDEAPERLKQVFDRIDANSDGQLEQAELKEFAAKARPAQ